MAKKVETLAKKGACLAYETLIAITSDTEAKPADRIAAAKALLDRADAARSRAEEAEGGTLKIVLDGVPGEYLN